MDELKDIETVEVSWICRFHLTNWFHEVGCPHQDWTIDQLRSALVSKKKFEQWRLSQNPNDPQVGDTDAPA